MEQNTSWENYSCLRSLPPSHDISTGLYSEPVDSNPQTQTGSGVHPASYSMGAGNSYPGGKDDHSPQSNVEGKNEWSYTSTTPVHLHVCGKNSYPGVKADHSPQSNV